MGKYDYGRILPEVGSIRWAFDMVAPNSTVLELGPANGLLTQHLAEEKACLVDIVEIDAESGKDAAPFCRNALLGEVEGNLETDHWHKTLAGNQYDYILFIDVLEHLRNPLEALRHCVELLKDDGSILLSIPNIAHNAVLINLCNNRFEYQDLGILDSTHIRFFTQSSVEKMVHDCGLIVSGRDITEDTVEENFVQSHYSDVTEAVSTALKTRNNALVVQYLFEVKKNGLEAAPIEHRAIAARCTAIELDEGMNPLPQRVDSENIHYYQRNELRLGPISKWKKLLIRISSDPCCIYNPRFFGEKHDGSRVEMTACDKNGSWKDGLGVVIEEAQFWFDLSGYVDIEWVEITLDGIELLPVPYQECLSDSERKAFELKKALEEQNEDLECKKNDIRELKQHIKLLLQSERDKLGQIDALNTYADYLRTSIADREKKIDLLENSIVELEDQIDDLHRTIKVSENQVEDLQETIKRFEDQNAAHEVNLRNKEGHIQLLLQSERDNLAEIGRLNRALNEACNMSVSRKALNKILPKGTRRRFVVKVFAKTLRHPIRVVSSFSPHRWSMLVSELKSGQMELLQQQLAKRVDRIDLQLEAPEIKLIKDTATIVSAPSAANMVQASLSQSGDVFRKEDYGNLNFSLDNAPTVSIIIPVYNQFDYTYKCLKSILLNSGAASYEIILADDCSTDLTLNIEEIVHGIRVCRTSHNLRFLLNCNNAAKEARGKYILFLNNDTQVQKDWLQPLVDLIERDESIGMVGSKLIYPDGRLQEAGGILWRDGSAWNYGNGQDPSLPEFNYVKDVDYISGAAIMIRADLWRKIGGFDEQFAPAYCEDSDLAFAVREAGYRVFYQPKSVVVHFEGVSNGTDTSSGLKAYQVRNSKMLFEKWKHVLNSHNDNGVNPFLARDRSLHKKTLLFVDHYVPMFDKDAGSRTVFAYIRMFVKAGYNVKFIGDNFFQHEPYTTILQQMGVEVLYGPWYANHWKEWILNNAASFDYAFLNRPHIAINYIDYIREKTKAVIFYYGHDLHFLRIQREYEVTGEKKLLREAEQWKEKELSLMRKADVSAYPSEVEIEEIRKIDPKIKAIAIPAYLFDDVASMKYEIAGRQDLFFIGGFTHGPNVDGVKWFIREVMPLLRKELPGVRMHITGSDTPQELLDMQSEDVIMEGMITDEQLEQFYKQMRLNVVPLRYGAGIKGKIVESMRYGLPVITTSCGSEGILDAEQILTIADTAEEMVSRIVNLYGDEEALKRISETGKDYVNAHYSEREAIKVLDGIFSFQRFQGF